MVFIAMFGGPHPNIAIKNTGVFKYSVVILSLSLSLSREGGAKYEMEFFDSIKNAGRFQKS